MENSETHYLTYDPDAIYREMQYAYIDAGGDALYPGDEKEMMLRSVQSIMVSAFAGVDNALRMATLQYAVGDYLDLIGDKRGCHRIEAQPAKAVIEITFKNSGIESTIPAGTTVTADGEVLYLLDEDVQQYGIHATIRVPITAAGNGSSGNGLTAGTQMQFVVAQATVESIYCVENAAGGQEKEKDDAYRERIREFGLQNVTTGPQDRYEAVAKSVSSEILDVNALNQGAGNVGIVLLLSTETGVEGIIDSVKAALNTRDTRPLTDYVSVFTADDIDYTLNVQYKEEYGSSLSTLVSGIVAEYKTWQDNTIGRAFNPDRLMAALYQAGASRVIWGEGSNFDGGAVQYTEIAASEHCRGTITIEVIP